MAIAAIAGVQLIFLIVHWLSRRIQRESEGVAPEQTRNNHIASLVNNGVGSSEQERTIRESTPKEDNPSPPDPVVQNMYLEITNISQGVNIGLLIFVVTAQDFYSSLVANYYSAPLFALTDLVISVIFWTRYYFDTGILKRSYTAVSTIWFFAYLVAQGVSIIFITVPHIWLVSTGVFLLFGCGFYVLNLMEIRRKQNKGIPPERPSYVNWQRGRLVDLIVLSMLAIAGAYLVFRYPVVALPAAVCALMASFWQIAINRDYRRLGFINTGA
jgi:hypothetical protein